MLNVHIARAFIGLTRKSWPLLQCHPHLACAAIMARSLFLPCNIPLQNWHHYFYSFPMVKMADILLLNIGFNQMTIALPRVTLLLIASTTALQSSPVFSMVVTFLPGGWLTRMHHFVKVAFISLCFHSKSLTQVT